MSKMGSGQNRKVLAVLFVIIAAFVADGTLAGAQSPAHQKVAPGLTSYLVASNNGAPVGSYASACTKTGGCPDGLRLYWSRSGCWDNDRMAPIVIQWMYAQKPIPTEWPIVVACSVGINLTWSAKNFLTGAAGRGALTSWRSCASFRNGLPARPSFSTAATA